MRTLMALPMPIAAARRDGRRSDDFSYVPKPWTSRDEKADISHTVKKEDRQIRLPPGGEWPVPTPSRMSHPKRADR